MKIELDEDEVGMLIDCLETEYDAVNETQRQLDDDDEIKEFDAYIAQITKLMQKLRSELP